MHAVIGGSGLYALDTGFKINRSDAPDTPYGQVSAELKIGEFHGQKLVFLPRHGDSHQIPPHRINYRANLWALQNLGVRHIIAVNAVGGISSHYQPGTLAVPDQLIDYTWGRSHTFSMTAADDLQHVEFAKPFDGRLRSKLLTAATVAQLDVADGGCIGVTQGPRLESAAEIRKFKRDGCDMVGMTSMPEAALAREAGLDYASLCINANWGAGLESEPVTMEAIEATLADAMFRVRSLLGILFKDFSNVR